MIKIIVRSEVMRRVERLLEIIYVIVLVVIAGYDEHAFELKL